MSIARQIGAVSASIESRTKAFEFVSLCKYLMMAGPSGTPAAALLEAEAGRAPPSVKDVLKAAVAAGTSTATGWASELAQDYRQIAAGFIESLRNESAFQRMLSDNAFRVVPLRTRIGAVSSLV